MDQLSAEGGPEGLFTGGGWSAETVLPLPAPAFRGKEDAAGIGMAAPHCTKIHSINGPFPCEPTNSKEEGGQGQPEAFLHPGLVLQVKGSGVASRASAHLREKASPF